MTAKHIHPLRFIFSPGAPRAVRWAALAVPVLIPALVFCPACTSDAAKPAANVAPALAVHVARVQVQPLDKTLDTTGSLVSSVAVDVKTEFAGRVAAMLKQEGERVRQGELVARLDDLNARLAVGQAQATLEVAQAALERTRVAEAHTRAELERAQNLVKSGGITDRDLLTAAVAAQDARAQAKLGEAQVNQAQQALAVAEKHWNDCRIISPIAGEVERKVVNPGSWVDGNALLYRLVDNQRLELQTYVASSDLAGVTPGLRIRFTVAAYPEETFEARIMTLSAAVDAQSRSALVRAAVPNPKEKLKAGMFVKGKIITGTNPSAIVVPAAAVWRRVGQPSYVYAVEQNRARKQIVQTGQEETRGIEITSGLKSGDVIVTDQNLELADGVPLTPIL